MKRTVTWLIISIIVIPVMGQLSYPGMKALRGKKYLNLYSVNRQTIGFREKSSTPYKSVNTSKLLRDSIISEMYVDSISQWVIYGKSEYTYDANGNNILYFYYKKDLINDTWNPSVRAEYSYNEARQITKYAFYNWDTLTSNWEPTDSGETGEMEEDIREMKELLIDREYSLMTTK